MYAFSSMNQGSAVLISFAYSSGSIMFLFFARVSLIVVLVFDFNSFIILSDSRIFSHLFFIRGEHIFLNTSWLGAGRVMYNWVGRVFSCFSLFSMPGFVPLVTRKELIFCFFNSFIREGSSG